MVDRARQKLLSEIEQNLLKIDDNIITIKTVNVGDDLLGKGYPVIDVHYEYAHTKTPKMEDFMRMTDKIKDVFLAEGLEDYVLPKARLYKK